MKLCDELNTSEDSADKSSGGLDDGGNSEAHSGEGMGSSSSGNSRGWKDSFRTRLRDAADWRHFCLLEPRQLTHARGVTDTRVVQSDANSTAALSSTQGRHAKAVFARPPGTAAGQLRWRFYEGLPANAVYSYLALALSLVCDDMVP